LRKATRSTRVPKKRPANAALAHLMADDLLLSYIGEREVTELFNTIRQECPPS
jgi:hypothetical protein